MVYLKSDVVHRVENVLVHDVDLHADLVAEGGHRVLQIGEIGGNIGNIDQHDHREEPGHDGEARSILTGQWIDEDLAHQANEYIDIDKLILTAKIYANALIRLTAE